MAGEACHVVASTTHFGLTQALGLKINMSAKAMRYELWQDDVEGSLSFFPEDSDSFRSFLGPDARLVWSCLAESWEQAQSMKHQHLGWEPYKPSP